jgi:hypothetical protein
MISLRKEDGSEEGTVPSGGPFSVIIVLRGGDSGTLATVLIYD